MTLKNILGVDHAVVAVGDLDGAAEAGSGSDLPFRRAAPTAPRWAPATTRSCSAPIISSCWACSPRPGRTRRPGHFLPAPAAASSGSLSPPLMRRRVPTKFAPVASRRSAQPISSGRSPCPTAGKARRNSVSINGPSMRRRAASGCSPASTRPANTVWIPQLQTHANTAIGIERIVLVSPAPQADAEHLARMIDGDVHSAADGAFVVPSGPDRADFVFATRAQLDRQFEAFRWRACRNAAARRWC